MHVQRATLLALISILSWFTGRAQATPETDFWQWFQQNESALFDFELDQERTFDRLAAEMHKVHPSLTFEFGPKYGGQREFVISADGIREAFPKVESLFSSAPPLPKWKFVKFRPRREPFDIQYGGVSVKASAVSVRMQPEGRQVGLTVFIPGYTKASHQVYTGIAFILLDQALGEYNVETRVGYIEIEAPNAAEHGTVPLQQLPDAFDDFLLER